MSEFLDFLVRWTHSQANLGSISLKPVWDISERASTQHCRRSCLSSWSGYYTMLQGIFFVPLLL